MRLTYWAGPIDNLGGLFRTMGVALLDDDICRDVRQFIRRTRLRRGPHQRPLLGNRISANCSRTVGAYLVGRRSGRPVGLRVAEVAINL